MLSSCRRFYCALSLLVSRLIPASVRWRSCRRHRSAVRATRSRPCAMTLQCNFHTFHFPFYIERLIALQVLLSVARGVPLFIARVSRNDIWKCLPFFNDTIITFRKHDFEISNAIGHDGIYNAVCNCISHIQRCSSRGIRLRSCLFI